MAVQSEHIAPARPQRASVGEVMHSPPPGAQHPLMQLVGVHLTDDRQAPDRPTSIPIAKPHASALRFKKGTPSTDSPAVMAQMIVPPWRMRQGGARNRTVNHPHSCVRPPSGSRVMLHAAEKHALVERQLVGHWFGVFSQLTSHDFGTPVPLSEQW